MDAGRWDDFRYFLAVAKTSSIKKAAAKLQTTQSAVSKRIDRLEAALNVRLFERGPAGAKITYQGQRILNHVLSAEGALSRAQDGAQDAASRIVGDCSLRLSDGIANYWIADFLAGFFRRYPDIELKMMLETDELAERKELFDLRLHYAPPTDTDQIAKNLCTIHFIPFASRRYLEEYGTPRAIEDLARHRLIDQAQYLISKGTWAALLSDNAVKHTSLFTNQSSFLARAVMMDVGIAMMPTYMAIKDNAFVPLDIGLRIPLKLYASYGREQMQKNAVKTTLNFLRERVFDLKIMPWFEDKFVPPAPDWRDLHREAVARCVRDSVLQPLAAE
ncbi:MAG: LysR family transcriptional regulator [Proteobacteria bacterium]|nr:LysR family transcriptional regulator [Pseudomonadota bacterium]